MSTATKEEFALPVLVPMDPIPVGSNPFSADLYHMGCNVSGSWMAMFDQHAGSEYPDPSYIIMVNTKTGQRFKMVFKFDKDDGDFMNAILRAREAGGGL